MVIKSKSTHKKMTTGEKMRKETNYQNLESNNLPQTGLLRLRQVLTFIPVSASTWWSGVKDGVFPQPVRLSKRVTAWRVEDIRELIVGKTDYQKG
jgi:prophage regulatory protein